MAFPKVLLGTPLNNFKDSNLHINRQDYSVPNWFEHIEKLTYPTLTKYFVDNSTNIFYHEKIQAKGYDCDWVNARECSNKREVIAQSYNKIREKLLNSDNEYLMVIEMDNYPPYNVIEYLTAICEVHEFPIVCLPYFTGKAKDARILIEDIERQSTLKQNTRVLNGNEALRFMDGDIKRIYNAGMGCILIHRVVLEEIEFRYAGKNNKAYPDGLFAEDCYLRGLPIYLDTKYICKHHNLNWVYKN